MTDRPNINEDFLVVGIGASAGGMNAFSVLLSHLPTNTNMAFVLVQHLDPWQESLLTELISRTTDMPVHTVEDGMVIEANHVYVIPPNVQMTLAERRLQLATCDQTQRRVKTVDIFFRSLAADQKNKAIAIVLSGSNNDGSAGVEAVRAEGGITFAQERTSAEFPEMPGAAISTGQVDFVLSPAEIAQELVAISRQPYLQESAPQREESLVFEDGDLTTVHRLLQKRLGIDFSEYKSTTFERRLRRRMALHKLAELSQYIRYLRDNPAEVQALYHDVLITVTGFFRDAEVYAVLQERVFPAIVEEDSAATSIRIWVPGCATGEEVYSLAICLLESLDPLLISPNIQIFGTDVSDRAIEEARAGIYPENRLENVSPERRRRFFSEVEGGYQINKSVREMCVFARQDLSSDPPFSDIDLVSCRNVLIYFKPPLQQRVLSVFHYSLKPSGFLLLGNSENVGETSDLFETFDTQAKVYTRKSVPTHLNFEFIVNHYPQESPAEQQPSQGISLNRANVQQWADQIVISRYAPVGVIVDNQLNIIQFRGDTSPYLRPPQGDPSFNLLKMIRPSLLVDVRATLEQAREEGVSTKFEGLALEDAPAADITVEVIPFTVSASQDRCFLILFERRTAGKAASQPAQAHEPRENAETPHSESDRLRRELAGVRQELLDTQTFLQFTIEEQESTHQQLVAANEEILSSNEELKSTNEELQTAKEEIQSANEELKTTNEELQSRNTEARRANDDLINLINNVNIPILMLNADLCIRSFTPAAQGVFNLIPSDVGRPISNIRIDVDIDNLEPMILRVIETLNTVEREVQDSVGRWYLLRIRPYRTVENQISGAVVALVDIDNLKRVEQDLRESQARLESELEAISQVQAVSRQLFTSLDLTQALGAVLDAAIAIFPTNMGNVQLYDPERQVLEIVAHRGFRQDFLDYFREVRVEDGSACGRALREGHRIILEDIEHDPEFAPHRQIAAAAGYRAVQSTPLMSRSGDPLGILSIHFSQPYRPSERELQMLDLYARQASEFIELIHTQREQQALVERERAAHEANANKDEFLSVLSHELRTPLSGILGWVQLMERGILNEADQQQAIASIKRGARVQLKLIEDLLDVSRIIQGRFQITPESTDLTEVLQQAIDLVLPQATAKAIPIETEFANDLEALMVDSHRMGQIFANVLSNAVKFTPPEGRITVRLVNTPSQVQVQVSDTGEGIAPEVLPDIFDRFRQADVSNTRREGGLGLGLFLVRSIVESHGGTVAAESPGIGQGTTITMTLPKVRAESAPSDHPVPPTPTSETFLEGVRVLLVEDDDTSLAALTLSLEQFGAIVSTAKSATEALEIMTAQSFDVLVSDIGLPKVSGYELMRRVRSLPAEQGSNIPAIALTGYVSEQDIQATLEAGFQIHLGKPIEMDHLLDAILSLIQA